MLDGITTLFFDLDGTLNELEDHHFMTTYAREAYKHFLDQFETFEEFVTHLVAGTMEMFKNDNENYVVEAFFDYFCQHVSISRQEAMNRFIRFYETNFDELRNEAGKVDYAVEVIEEAKNRGYKLVLATQPMFYELATRKRVQWIGLNPDDLLVISHALNAKASKPNPSYFRWLLEEVGSKPEETLMIGNDPNMDLGAAKVGIKTWMTTQVEDTEIYPDYTGSLKDLYEAIVRQS